MPIEEPMPVTEFMPVTEPAPLKELTPESELVSQIPPGTGNGSFLLLTDSLLQTYLAGPPELLVTYRAHSLVCPLRSSSRPLTGGVFLSSAELKGEPLRLNQRGLVGGEDTRVTRMGMLPVRF